jgi:hypothetical protein
VDGGATARTAFAQDVETITAGLKSAGIKAILALNKVTC